MNQQETQDSFVWTGELVLEFARFTLHESPTFQGRYADLEQFKASKQQSHMPKEDKINYDTSMIKAISEAFSAGRKVISSPSGLVHEYPTLQDYLKELDYIKYVDEQNKLYNSIQP